MPRFSSTHGFEKAARMNVGRTSLGISTADRTTLIGSTHRIYAISEKQMMGDGRGNSERIPTPTTAKGRELDERARGFLPDAALSNARHGLRRLMDYQDAEYAGLYLDRLQRIAALDRDPYLLTSETARHLALWMSYEDTIRVADLKTRASRIARVRSEVMAQDGQILEVTEFMHPRLREIGETLPAPIGRLLLGDGVAAKMLAPFFRKGRHVRTTSLFWFLILRLIAKLRAIRRSTIRYAEEQERIDRWIALAADLAKTDNAAAVEWIRCQQLIKGYGETFERGLRNFISIRDGFFGLRERDRTASWLAEARAKALEDQEGTALESFLKVA